MAKGTPRTGARGGRRAKAIAKQERFENGLYERGVLTSPEMAREIAQAADEAARELATESAQPVQPEQHPHSAYSLLIDPEFESLIPPQTDEENIALEESLLREGCRDALVVWKDHNILVDGHNRYAICKRHGLSYAVREREFASREDVVVWMVKNQLARRNIVDFMKTELVLRMKSAIEAKAKANQAHGQTAPGKTLSQTFAEPIETREELGKTADVSRETVRKVEKVLSDAPEPIKKKARNGHISTNRAYLMTQALKGADPQIVTFVTERDMDDAEKVEILKRLHKSAGSPESNGTFDEIMRTGGFHYGNANQWCDFIKDRVQKIQRALDILSEQHKRMAVEARKAERETIPGDMPEHEARYTLHVGDFTDALFATPDRSIDCIITDPPYGGDALHLYEQLAREAARLLKPGGSLLVMCGQYHLPDVLHRMSMHIRYHWMLSYLTPGGQSPQIFPRKVNTFWKPVLWFVQGDYKGEWIGDVARSAVNDNDKRFHAWGQSESGMAELVEKFTCAGDVILDPFIGGGTTAIVALKLNRQIIGVDKDAAHIETTRERIEQWLLTTSGK